MKVASPEEVVSALLLTTEGSNANYLAALNVVHKLFNRTYKQFQFSSLFMKCITMIFYLIFPNKSLTKIGVRLLVFIFCGKNESVLDVVKVVYKVRVVKKCSQNFEISDRLARAGLLYQHAISANDAEHLQF